jgi:hypothetical protein
MELMRVAGTGGWIEYDGEHLKIVRDGVWNTLTGMAGIRELDVALVSSIRFRKAIRAHGGGFIQFLRVDDPLAKMQKKMLGVYGRKDDIAAASLDPYALSFNFRQQSEFAALKDLVERDAGLAPSPIEEPTEAIPVEPMVDFTAKKPPRSGWVRFSDQQGQRVDESEPSQDDSDTWTTPTGSLPGRPVRVAATAPRVAVVAPSPSAPHSDRQASTDESALDPIDAIRRLAGLRDSGIITQAEFDTKKAELLTRL